MIRHQIIALWCFVANAPTWPQSASPSESDNARADTVAARLSIIVAKDIYSFT